MLKKICIVLALIAMVAAAADNEETLKGEESVYYRYGADVASLPYYRSSVIPASNYLYRSSYWPSTSLYNDFYYLRK